MDSQPPDERPTSPWRPAGFRVHGVYPVTRTPKRGPKAGRTVRYYDVRYTADGFAFSMRFERKGWADAFADQLRERSALGYQLVPATRRFLEPADTEDAPTVVAFTAEYFASQWPSWSPASRRNNQRELAVACVYLVRDDARRRRAGRSRPVLAPCRARLTGRRPARTRPTMMGAGPRGSSAGRFP